MKLHRNEVEKAVGFVDHMLAQDSQNIVGGLRVELRMQMRSSHPSDGRPTGEMKPVYRVLTKSQDGTIVINSTQMSMDAAVIEFNKRSAEWVK